MEDLLTLGVRTQEYGLGWYRFESAEGYRFRMPGVPLAARQRYRFAGEEVGAIFYDLAAEQNSRGYLLRAFDASALDESEREELRVEAEAMILRAGENPSDPVERSHRGVVVVERTVQGLSINGHYAIVRTMVWGHLVFQLTVIVPAAAGAPTDATQFFDSLRLTSE